MWIKNFLPGNLSQKGGKRSGQSTNVCDDQINVIIEEDFYTSIREIAKKLNISHTTHETTENHLHGL